VNDDSLQATLRSMRATQTHRPPRELRACIEVRHPGKRLPITRAGSLREQVACAVVTLEQITTFWSLWAVDGICNQSI